MLSFHFLICLIASITLIAIVTLFIIATPPHNTNFQTSTPMFKVNNKDTKKRLTLFKVNYEVSRMK